MDKLDTHPPDLTADNLDRLAAVFPQCVTEARDERGRLRRMVDFDRLRQELSGHLVDGPRERYGLDWPGKREALLAASTPIAKTLRPCRGRSVDFDRTRHLFIEGDNLDALKLLQNTYQGQVKMIYIDPPYNTGGDFIYDDDFSEDAAAYFARSAPTDTDGRFHAHWLSMIYPRLRLARNLLRDDGAIFISIDDHEAARLTAVCDEVFGGTNFVANIVWQKVFAPKNSARWFSEDHDYILVYAKEKERWRPNPLPTAPETIARYTNPDADPRGPWQSDNLTARNRYAAGLYPVACPSGRIIDGPPKGSYWRVSRANFARLDADRRVWWGAGGNNMPRLKRFLSEVKAGRTPQTLWPWKEVGHTQDAKKELLRYIPFEHTANVLHSVKPTSLIQRMLQLATRPRDNDLILDFFCGSGATAHAVLKQNAADDGNRRFIAVQIDEPLPAPEKELKSILDLATTRVRTYGQELDAGSPAKGRLQDVGFRMLRVDTFQRDRTPEELVFQALLNWGMDLSRPIEQRVIAGQNVFLVDGNALVACFDADIGEEVVRELARCQPRRAVFRDGTRANVEQLFRSLSPGTELRSL